jgi:hypothetical protein
LRIDFFSSIENLGWLSFTPNFFWIHSTTSGFQMYTIRQCAGSKSYLNELLFPEFYGWILITLAASKPYLNPQLKSKVWNFKCWRWSTSFSYRVCLVNKCLVNGSHQLISRHSLWILSEIKLTSVLVAAKLLFAGFLIISVIPKSKPWKKQRLNALDSLNIDHNCAKNSVCAAFKNENLSIIFSEYTFF